MSPEKSFMCCGCLVFFFFFLLLCLGWVFYCLIPSLVYQNPLQLLKDYWFHIAYNKFFLIVPIYTKYLIFKKLLYLLLIVGNT